MGIFKKEVTSNKIGRVRKCPQCGASVPSSKVVCPECGWEFDDGNDKESAVQKLAAELKKTHGIFGKNEGEVIRAFPIPKTKNDLLELTIYFKSRKSDSAKIKGEVYAKVFKEKYEECIAKAKQFYPNDKDFITLIREYDNEKRNTIIRIVVTSIIVVVIGVVGVVIGILFL